MDTSIVVGELGNWAFGFVVVIFLLGIRWQAFQSYLYNNICCKYGYGFHLIIELSEGPLHTAAALIESSFYREEGKSMTALFIRW